MTSLKWLTGSREISGTSILTGLLCHWHLIVLYVALKQHCTKQCNIESIYTAWRMQKDMDTFPRHWPYVVKSIGHRLSPVWNGQWREALMFSLMCIWTNCWANSWVAGDLRRHGAHAASLPTMATLAWITLKLVITMTSWWARWRLKSPASTVYSDADQRKHQSSASLEQINWNEYTLEVCSRNV